MMPPSDKNPNWEENAQKTIKFLVENGSDLTIKNTLNKTAADMASEVKRLSKLGSFVDLMRLLSNNDPKILSPKTHEKISTFVFNNPISVSSTVVQVDSKKSDKGTTTTETIVRISTGESSQEQSITIKQNQKTSNSGSSGVSTQHNTMTVTIPQAISSSSSSAQRPEKKRKIEERKVIDLTGDDD